MAEIINVELEQEVELQTSYELSGGIIPTGTINITTNGTHDVTTYASANVNVQGGVTPTGTKEIEVDAAGTTTEDVTNYASVEITVPQGQYKPNIDATPTNPSISVSNGGLITAEVMTQYVNDLLKPSFTEGYIKSSDVSMKVKIGGSATQQLNTVNGQTVTPTTSTQYIAVQGDYVLGAINVGPIPSQYVIPTGTLSISQNGQGIDVKDYEYVNVSVSGGREDLTVPKDVDYIDYDGRLLYSYTAQEFAQLSAHPSNPTNSGLTAQGWNWTLADAQSFVATYGSLVIGQSYTTSNGRTRVYVSIPNGTSEQMKLGIYATFTVAKGGTVYWGDGTSSVWANSTNNSLVEHQYSSGGDYTIEIEVNSGATISYLGKDGANGNILGATSGSTALVRGAFCKKIEIGDKVTGIARNFCKCMNNLESITIPITLTTIVDYNENLFECNKMGGIVFPINLTTTRYRAMFPSYMVLKYISIPKGMKNIQIGTYQGSLRKLTMYSNEPSSGVQSTIKLYDVRSLTHFAIGGTYTTIQTDTLRSSQVKKLFIPSSVTSISATAFAYNYYLEEVHVYPTTPPTLGSANAFNGLPSTCKIYVPTASLSTYQNATNWSTYADRMVGE